MKRLKALALRALVGITTVGVSVGVITLLYMLLGYNVVLGVFMIFSGTMLGDVIVTSYNDSKGTEL